MVIVHEEDGEIECPICNNLKQNAPQWQLQSCGHSFCHGCLQTFLRTPDVNKVCPLCRVNITDEDDILASDGRENPVRQASFAEAAASAPPPREPPAMIPRIPWRPPPFGAQWRSPFSGYMGEEFRDRFPHGPPRHLGSPPQHFPDQMGRYALESRTTPLPPYNSDGSINPCLVAASNNNHPDPIIREMLSSVARQMLSMTPRPSLEVREVVFEIIADGTPGVYEIDDHLTDFVLEFVIPERESNTRGRTSFPLSEHPRYPGVNVRTVSPSDFRSGSDDPPSPNTHVRADRPSNFHSRTGDPLSPNTHIRADRPSNFRSRSSDPPSLNTHIRADRPSNLHIRGDRPSFPRTASRTQRPSSPIRRARGPSSTSDAELQYAIDLSRRDYEEMERRMDRMNLERESMERERRERRD